MNRNIGLGLGMGLASLLVFACSVTTKEADPSSSSSSSSGGGSSSGGSSSGATASGSSSGGSSSGGSSGQQQSSSGSVPPAASKDENVEINAACPSFTACGGSPQGTYDYTGGCIGDVFAEARQKCPSLQTSNVTSTVKGSIYFIGNSGLTREVTANVSGTILLPAACSAGQCAMAESALSGAFDSAKCVAQSGGCSCTVSRTSFTKDATTYTVNGTSLKTADGDVYSICEKAGSLGYQGKSAGSEEGHFTLVKR